MDGQSGTPKDLSTLEAELQRTQNQLRQMERLYQKAAKERDDLMYEKALLQEQFDSVSNSRFWKMTGPFRRALDAMKRVLNKFPGFQAFRKFLQHLRRNGFRSAMHKVKMYRIEQKKLRALRRRDQSKITAEQREIEEGTIFEKEITFSILVPLYNTPIQFLHEMIESVRAQTYPKWELCLADGSDAIHGDVETEVRRLMEKEPRIRYRKLEQNLGISENTNACIDLATGEYIALFDHDDVLHPSALFEMMKAICEKNADFVYTDENTFSDKPSKAYCPHHKPNFSPDLLRSYNYICHFTAFSRELLEQVGRFRSAFDGSQDYDMILRLTEQAKNIVHIPKILYFWRSHANSVASDISAKPYTLVAAKKALSEHLERVGLIGDVMDSRVPSTYRIRYRINGDPLVSIIIPNMDHVQILKKCIDSVEMLSTYRNFEILIVENNSRSESTFEYYESVCRQYSNVRVIQWEHEFNYSKINNFAVEEAKGEYLLFLNNDIEIITPMWIEEMLMFNQREDVAATGIMLYYPDDTVQHAGVILGIGGVAGHSHKYFNRNETGYMSRLSLAQNLSAVTAACMMVKTKVFHEVGCFDETLQVAFNDVDLCMKIREAGHLIVWTPYAEAYHYESKSRGAEDTPEKQIRFNKECARFMEKWGAQLKAGDPYYNPHLSLEFEDFRLK